MVPRVVDTTFLQHHPNPLHHSLSAFWQNRPKRCKVGDTLTAGVVDRNGKDVSDNVTFQWYADDVAIEGATDETLGVTVAMIGSTIKVVATAENGNTFESEETAEVKGEDKAAEIKLIDKTGLQADGTALPTDLLTVSYGQDLGTPSTVIWWCDGAVKAVYTTEGGALVDAFTSAPLQTVMVGGVAQAVDLDEGEWWVTIENTEGVTSTTNVITVTPSHIAIIEDVDITDDYDGGNVELLKNVTKAVVTVTLNKDYAGTFYLTPVKTSAFNSTDLTAKMTTANAKTTEVKTLAKLTDKAAIDTTANKGIYYLDKDTNEITYKFALDHMAGTPILTRGTDYYLIFDQDDYEGDDLPTATGTGKLDDLDLNITDAITMPYVEAPDSVAVTNYAKGNAGAEKIKVTLYDEEGNALAWYTPADGTTTLGGFGTTNIYNISSNTASASDPAITPATSVASKGVATLTYTGTNTQYAYVKLVSNAGVFDKETITLTSDVVETNGPALTSLSIAYDSSDPTSAKVTLKNLTSRTNGTVYIFQSNVAVGAATDSGTTSTEGADEKNAAKITAQAKDGLYMVGSAEVTGGTTSVVIPNVFSKDQIGLTQAAITDNGATASVQALKYNDYFAALFVPEDTEQYAESTSATYQLKSELKSYKLNQAVSGITKAGISGITSLIKGVDQFGQDITLDATSGAALDAADLAATTLDPTVDTAATDAKIAIAFATDGTVTVTETAGTADTTCTYAKGTSKSVTLPGGQKLTIKVNTIGTGAAGTAKYDLSIS